jgi:hypothetical protein
LADGIAADAAGKIYVVSQGDNVVRIFEADGRDSASSRACARRAELLHTFASGQDGIYPYGGPILDAAGNVYGRGLAG